MKMKVRLTRRLTLLQTKRRVQGPYFQKSLLHAWDATHSVGQDPEDEKDESKACTKKDEQPCMDESEKTCSIKPKPICGPSASSSGRCICMHADAHMHAGTHA